jgi:polysaccharide biosynthesis protein PslH
MKVAIVNEGLGYPAWGGNWIRTLNLMLPLAGRHDITYICRGAQDHRAVEVARDFYEKHGITFVVSRDFARPNRGIRFYSRLAANLASSLPYSVAAHRSRSVRRAIRHIADTEDIDIWQFEAVSYLDAIPAGASATVLMAHNVESLIWQRLGAAEQNRLKRWYISEQCRKYERFERGMFNRATRVVAVSEEDAALMRDRFGITEPVVVDNGVDVERYAALAHERRPSAGQILFLGSLDWRPNVDAVEYLLDSIMPRIWSEEPNSRLCIVGRQPTPSLVRRACAEGRVELHADVPDVRPYLASSAVMAVPLRIGGGSRLKILEAAAAGLPVVSTSIGAEGLALNADRDLLIADDADGLADGLLQCLRLPEGAEIRARSALRIARQRYDWRQLADRLESVWLDVHRSSQRHMVGH